MGELHGTHPGFLRLEAAYEEARAEIARLTKQLHEARGVALVAGKKMDDAHAEIARLEKELAECREELAGAVLIGREDRLRATEAERALEDLLARGEKLIVSRYSAGSDMDHFIAAWNRARRTLGRPPRLDAQARRGEDVNQEEA